VSEPLDWPERAAQAKIKTTLSRISPVWRRKGLYTRSLSSITGAHREAAHWAGYRAISIQFDSEYTAGSLKELNDVRFYRENGWAVVGWATFGYNTDPYNDGRRHAMYVDDHHLDGFMPNGEVWAEGADRWKSEAYMQGWLDWHRENGVVLPPLMLSCMSSVTGNFARDMDFKPWVEYPGCAISPQCYTASNPDYTFPAMYLSYSRTIVPFSLIVPSINVEKNKPVPAYPPRSPWWLYCGEDVEPNQFALL